MTTPKNNKIVGGQIPQDTNNVSNRVSSGEQIFMLSNPINFIFFMSFFSPIILVVMIVSLSFLFQNFKGLIYLGFILGVCIIRRYVLEFSGFPEIESDGTICTAIQFSKYGNITFSTFVFSFTFMYLCMPMFQNNSVNWSIFSGLIFYIFLDIGIKMYEGCLSVARGASLLFVDILAGMSLGILVTLIMYATGNSKYMFFNEMSSDKEICTRPTNQTFKCNVYKGKENI